LTNQLSASTRRRALELIDKNARSQAQIVADLVDMSRITSGKLSLDVLPLPVAPALESAVDSVRLAAEAKGVSIHRTAHPDDMVLADATRLQQILWNLLSNAVKFTPAGGQIQLRAQRHGDHIAIEVTDSGIGIDTRFLPHVFERFRQAESGSTRGYSGLGLGLAIVHDLVRLHGGTVEARSAGIGSGATFVVSLRRAEIVTSEQSAQRRPPNNHCLGGKVILLIEDHEDTRELTTQILRQAGMNVVPCASANAAFAVLHDQLPSAIVADIGLPDEDGISFIKRVRRHSSAHVRAVPAIALTAYTSAADQDDALRAGFQRHIGKPVDPSYLIDALRDILRAGSDG
jgi:CheY-like chemotaxis protein